MRRWEAQAKIGSGQREGLTTAERTELAQLCKENRVLREERGGGQMAKTHLGR